MKLGKKRVRIILWSVLPVALILAALFGVSPLSLGSDTGSTEAAPSSIEPDRVLARRLYMPIVARPMPTPTPRPTSTPLPTPTPLPTWTPVPPPSGSAPGAYLGAWVPGMPANTSALTSFQTTVGKNMAIVMWYQGWVGQETLNQTAAQTVARQGSIPMVTWEPWDWRAGVNQPSYSNASIAAGNWDAYIRSYAQSVKTFGKPIMIRFAHEMNKPGSGYPWAVGVNGNTSQSYVAAWRRVHDIFVSIGATNALWVWSPIIKYDGTTPFPSIYPGEAYVDWIGLDGYNGGSALPWGGWQWFSQLFGPSYWELTAMTQKPIMIAETASVEQGGSKADWIYDALLVQVAQNYPRIKGFVWFNENLSWEADWRIESSSGSLASYRWAAGNSYFRSSYP